MASWMQARSASLMQPNSSMQQTPPSARTSAPASRCQEPPSQLAATVRPALGSQIEGGLDCVACSHLVVPTPVVSTDRGRSLAAYFSS